MVLALFIWVGQVGDWSDSQDWYDSATATVGDGIPGEYDDANIGNPNATITITSPVVVHDLSDAANLIDDSSLTLGGSEPIISTGQSVIADGGKVSGTGQLINNGTLNLNDASISPSLMNAGTIMASGPVQITGPLVNSLPLTLGPVSNFIGPIIDVMGMLDLNGKTINDGTIELTQDNASDYGNVVALQIYDSLINESSGSIETVPGMGVGAAGTVEIDMGSGATLQNNGELSISTNTLLAHYGTNQFINEGAIDVKGSDLSIGGIFLTDAGRISISAGSVLSIDGGSLTYDGGPVSGEGTLSLSNLTATLNKDLAVAGGLIVGSYATVDGPGILINSGTMTLVDHGTIDSTLINKKTLVCNYVAYTNGLLVNETGATLMIEADPLISPYSTSWLYMNGPSTNYGNIELTQSANGSCNSYLYIGVSLVNQTSGMIRSEPGPGPSSAGLRGIYLDYGAALNNVGNLISDVSTSIERNGSYQFLNGGTINVRDGDLSFPNGIEPSNTGEITIGASRTLSMALDFENSGRLTIGPAGTLSLGGNYVQTSSGQLVIQIGGLAPAAVGGMIRSSGAMLGGQLNVSSSIVQVGRSLMILDNTGNSATQGTFAGLPEGAVLTTNGSRFDISYRGGDGNDVVLTAAVPLANIALTSASTDDAKSINLNYTVSGGDLGRTFQVAVYRSPTPNFNMNTAVPTGLVGTVPTTDSNGASSSAQGSHNVTVNLEGEIQPDTNLTQPNPYLFVVANPEGKGHIPESDNSNDTNNVAALGTVTLAQLRAIMPYLGSSKASAYIDALNYALGEFAIITPKRQAAFLGQVVPETASLNLWYEQPSKYTGPDFVNYDFRADLGNNRAGDGAAYRGRGPLQLTGRANYAAAGSAFGIDLVDNQNLLGNPASSSLISQQILLGFRVSGWYWTSAIKKINPTTKAVYDLNDIADLIDDTQPILSFNNLNALEKISYGVNGGYIALMDRINDTEWALAVLDNKLLH